VLDFLHIATHHFLLFAPLLFIFAVGFLMMLSTSDSSYDIGTNLARSLRISDPKNYVFLDIRSASVAKIIIGTKIYERSFDHFVTRFLGVRQKMAEKRAPCAFAAESSRANRVNQDQHQDDVAAYFDFDFHSDDDVIVDVPVMNDNEDEDLAMERDNCNLWINQPVDWTSVLTNISSKGLIQRTQEGITNHSRAIPACLPPQMVLRVSVCKTRKVCSILYSH
jgi:hypothetical protein